MESKARNPLSENGFISGLKSIETTLLRIESSVIYEMVERGLIIRVCNALKRAMDWTMKEVIDKFKSFNNH